MLEPANENSVESNCRKFVKYIVLFFVVGVTIYVLYDQFYIINKKMKSKSDTKCVKCDSYDHGTDTCPNFDPTIDYSMDDPCKDTQRKFFGDSTYKTTPDLTFGDQTDEDMYFTDLDYTPRNPMKNTKTYNKNSRSDSQSIRDIDDGVIDTFRPIGAIDCDGALGSEKINKYRENRYDNDQDNNVDAVERVNEFRKSDSRDHLGKPIMQIYDQMAGNKCYIKAERDKTGHSEYYLSDGAKHQKSFKRDNWAYKDESPINGGSLGGQLYPEDPESSTYMAL